MKIIARNFPIKIFCLTAAAVLWLYVVAGQNTVAKYPGSITIRPVNVSSGLVASFDEKSVEIKIMADPAVWKKLSSDSFNANIDATFLAEGTHELNVNVNCVVPDVQIIEKNPEKIIVKIESLIHKSLTVMPRIEGNAAEGMIPGDIEFSPDKVEAFGAKSLVETLSEATVVIKLNGEKEDFTRTYSIKAFDENNTIIRDIEFRPTEVEAQVAIEKGSNIKTVGIRVKTSGSPKPGYYLSEISTTPATVDILGSNLSITKINYIETETVDISGKFSETQIDALLKPLPGTTLASGSLDKVKVKIKFAQTESSKEVTPVIEARNLPTAYSISSYNPIQIKVLLSGPLETLNQINSSNVKLVLDFKDKTIVKGQGISFQITPADFTVPELTSITSILPTLITATVN